MTNAPKLKDVMLANVPMLLTLKSRGKAYPATDFQTKEFKLKEDGTQEMNYMYIFSRDDGGELVHFANEIEQQTLSSFNKGDKLQALRIEKKRVGKPSYFIIQWTVPGSAEASERASPTPTIQKHVVDHAREMKAEKTSIIMQAFTKSLLESGCLIPENKDPASLEAYAGEVTELAKKFYRLHRMAVAELLTEGSK